MKIPLFSAAIVGALLLSGCATGTDAAPEPTTPAASDAAAAPAAGESCSGVEVVVDFGILDSPSVTDCIDADAAIAAADAIAQAGVRTEGNADYGDAVVCRVDGRPAADETVEVAGEAPFTEPCSSMSPAYAFWALWVKPAADADWGFAMEGLSTLQAEPGQSIGLVYTTGSGTEPQPPAAD
ncbi:hypothetical protein [Microterricola pindariensis]|uniref:Septum formation-related domain-containing protein n=1 Tax=Microterricola pindariensis TaxID=478010 RepID=A0ABX5AZJ1_9MICO|nr:hypothetical protein [Microterricola pindariensis]PPL20328.1 hypothetical protein GY24_01955 [Microterricola pindariensis]